jgi:hypothetical protein
MAVSARFGIRDRSRDSFRVWTVAALSALSMRRVRFESYKVGAQGALGRSKVVRQPGSTPSRRCLNRRGSGGCRPVRLAGSVRRSEAAPLTPKVTLI